jgi:hypothetical protein
MSLPERDITRHGNTTAVIKKNMNIYKHGQILRLCFRFCNEQGE